MKQQQGCLSRLSSSLFVSHCPSLSVSHIISSSPLSRSTAHSHTSYTSSFWPTSSSACLSITIGRFTHAHLHMHRHSLCQLEVVMQTCFIIVFFTVQRTHEQWCSCVHCSRDMKVFICSLLQWRSYVHGSSDVHVSIGHNALLPLWECRGQLLLQVPHVQLQHHLLGEY
jgi:hypothetical protein